MLMRCQAKDMPWFSRLLSSAIVLSKQPRTSEEVIPGDLRLPLAIHSMLDNHPSLVRQALMKESARIAMVRMKYSQAIRKAEFSRARNAAIWGAFQYGDVIYFYREYKIAPGNGARGTRQKRLLLK